MEKSDTINELATALAKAQGEFQPAAMTAINPFLKNKYADLGAVIVAAKAACTKYGLAVSQPAHTQGESVTVTTLLMHQSGQWISSEMTLPLGKESGRSIAQAAGSIITYLRRYSLSAILGIYADEDTDGNSDAGHNGKGKETTPSPKAKEIANAAPPEPEPTEPVSQSQSVTSPGNDKWKTTKYDILYQAVVTAGFAPDMWSAKGALSKCHTGWDTNEKAIAWMKMYRGWRDSGLEPEAAAAKANAGELPK